jgi:hypothetical protein
MVNAFDPQSWAVVSKGWPAAWIRRGIGPADEPSVSIRGDSPPLYAWPSQRASNLNSVAAQPFCGIQGRVGPTQQ